MNAAHPGPWRGRADPASPKANPHWARLYAAKRRAIDIALLREAEKSIPATPEPPVGLGEPIPKPTTFGGDDMRAEIARAFGRPYVEQKL